MGASLQNQQPASGMQNPNPAVYPTIQSNNGQMQQTPNMPMGKGNVTNSATSGQPMMGQPNNNATSSGLGG